jgi:hypothetical protein
MNNESSLYKQIFRWGFLGYAVLFIFSFVFYKERTIFVDIAFHLFHIIRKNDFAIQVYRYGAVVTQIFPLAARRMSLSLNSIMLVYSVGVMLYYIACYTITGAVLKNYKIAVVMLCSQFLFMSRSFYWMQAELQQGLAFMLVVYAWLGNQHLSRPKPVSLVVAFALVVVLNFFHPLLIMPVIFVALFFYINKEEGYDWRVLTVALLVCIGLYFVKKEFFVNKYDEDAAKGFNNFIYTFPHYFGIASNRKFVTDCMKLFYWIPVAVSAVGVYYLIKRKWLMFIVFASFFSGFLLLVNVTFPHNNEADFYMENLYLPLGIIISFPLVYHFLPWLHQKKLAIPLVALIIITGAVRIYQMHYFHTTRINWQRTFLDKNIDKKLLMSNKEVPMDTLKILWGTPYEFWLLSTTEYNKTASVVMDEYIDKLLWYKWENKEFHTTIERLPYHMLQQPYFKLTDTVTHYDTPAEYIKQQ